MSGPTEILKQLIAIDSVSPSLVPGAAGEKEAAQFCANWLRDAGLEVHVLEENPGRPSVVGIARGSGGGQSLMLNGHLDTVTTAGYLGDPFAPIRDGGRIYGRGSYDMKGGVAAMMTAAAAVKSRKLAGDVLIALVSDEEHGSIGTMEVLRRFRADAAIVGEPTALNLGIAHKGFAGFHVNIHGRSAHGSRHDLGIDAIAKAGRFLVALESYGKLIIAGDGHDLLGTGSVHASIIRGGEEMSTYPSLCRISLERRTIPGESSETVETDLRAILDEIARSDSLFSYSLERDLCRPPFQEGNDSAIVEILSRKTEMVLGRIPERRGEAYWTDAALLKEAGIACVVFGPDGEGAHATTEWVDMATVENMATIVEAAAIEFCGATNCDEPRAFFPRKP